MVDEEVNCMVKAVISATGRPDLTDTLNAARIRQQSKKWGGRGYQTVEAEHLAELLKTAGDPRRIEVDTIQSLNSLVTAALLSQAVNAHVFVGLPRTTQNGLPHIVHIEKRAAAGFQSNQQFLPDYEIAEVLAEQNEFPVFFAFGLNESD